MDNQSTEGAPEASGFGTRLATEWARFRTLPWRGNARHTIAIIAALALVIAVGSASVWVVNRVLPRSGSIPIWGLQDYVQPESASDRAQLVETEVYATLALIEIIGGIVLLVTVIAAFYTANQTRKSLELGREQLRIAQDGQITDRFAKAIEMLGSSYEDRRPRMEVRLGAIFALERLAKDSCAGDEHTHGWCRDHWPIMEVLTAYLRNNSKETAQGVRENKTSTNGQPTAPSLVDDDGQPLKRNEPTRFFRSPRTELRTDIAAIVKVLGNRDNAQLTSEQQGRQVLDLHGAHLEDADLREAHLEDVDLREAHLGRAFLMGANLERADLTGAHLERAFLTGANLERAYLMGAHLEGARLEGANLKGARLENANLEGAYLMGAHLEGARLDEAHLEGARLSKVTGLTQEQIDASSMNERTLLPTEPGPNGQEFSLPLPRPDQATWHSYRQVCAYVTCQDRLLVYERPEQNGAGIPGDRLEWSDDVRSSVLPMSRAFSRLNQLMVARYLGNQWFEDPASGALTHRFYYHLTCNDDPEGRWEIKSDEGVRAFRWWPLADGLPELVNGLGARLPELMDSLGQEP